MGFDEGVKALDGWIGTVLQAERERWVLWLPVALGAGVAVYFNLPGEPARWIGPAILAVSAIAAIALRHRLPLLMAAIGLGAAALGFTVAVEHTQSVAASVLSRAITGADLDGRVLAIEPLEHGERVTLDRLSLLLPDAGPRPERVRVRLSDQAAAGLMPGERIHLRATLLPPPQPAAPGAYDFARQAWFLKIGAVGYALADPVQVATPPPTSWFDGIGIALARIRHDLTERIDHAIARSGAGAVAADLITGERGAVPPAILQNYRDAGLAHILVIAGMHMSMVAGLVFLAIRGVLAAIPWIALRYPIKKWAAGAALLVTFGYLVISGFSVPTQRAFIMNAIVLLAILLDREAISLRTISWAAMLVLLIEPEALVGPSFQMSFAAVYALIAGYEVMTPRLTAWREADRLGIWTGPALYLAGIMLTTLVAGGATAFYTVYHFNRYATYGLIGNLLAVPVVGFWVMPAALLALVLLPFGLDGWGWWLMGQGIDLVDRVASMTSHLPGAALDAASLPRAALVVFTLGALWLCLWCTGWRRLGLIAIAAGIVIALLHRPPDLLIDSTGRLAALRNADGRLVFEPHRGAKQTRETWAAMAGQGKTAPDWSIADNVHCDGQGCIWMTESHVVALARYPEATIEDCRIADVVVVPVPLFAACPSAKLMLDGYRLRRTGAQQIWLDDEEQPRTLSVAEWQGDRPWSLHLPPRRPKPETAPATESEPEPTADTDAPAETPEP
ncbi:MAG TPA: ComEC/Rec2 family competence protein [Magnetospirillaceae bacterium]|jgi:competence protein ComEC